MSRGSLWQSLGLQFLKPMGECCDIATTEGLIIETRSQDETGNPVCVLEPGSHGVTHAVKISNLAIYPVRVECSGRIEDRRSCLAFILGSKSTFGKIRAGNLAALGMSWHHRKWVATKKNLRSGQEHVFNEAELKHIHSGEGVVCTHVVVAGIGVIEKSSPDPLSITIVCK